MLPVSKYLCANNQCDEAANVHCSGCYLLCYCSFACREKHWSTHKKFCKATENDEYAPQPPADPIKKQICGILFDPDAHWGGFVPLQYSTIRPGYMKIDLGDVLAVTQEEAQAFSSVAPGYFDILRDSAYNIDLPYTIRVHYRDELASASSSDDGSDQEDGCEELEDDQGISGMKINKSMMEMLGMPRGYVRQWKGPIVAYGIESFTKDSHPTCGIDLQQDDARIIINYFRKIMNPVEMVNCVRVNCNGDVNFSNRPKYEPIMLPVQHAIFNQEPTPISSRIGFPITVARIPGSVDFWERKIGQADVFHPNVNQAVTFLHVGIDPMDDGKDFPLSAAWGFAPWTWDTPVGSCIIARKDKKSLLPGHIALLSEYCHLHLTSFFELQMEGDLKKTDVLNQISKKKFKAYLHAWRARQKEDDLREMVSPYKVDNDE